MVNIFGTSACTGERGPTGPSGPPGPAGVGSIEAICRWFPNMAIKETRFNEFCCLKIDNPSRDLVIDKGNSIIKWNSLSTKKNNFVKAEKKYSSKEYTRVQDNVFALKFNGQNVYDLADIELAPKQDDCWLWICTTFRPSVNMSNDDHYTIYTNKSSDVMFRGLSLTKNSIKIWGCENKVDNVLVIDTGVSIAGKWVTVYTFWSNMAERKGYYIIYIEGTSLELHGQFICQKTEQMFITESVSIGGYFEQAIVDSFKGDILCWELYTQDKVKDLTYPEKLKNLIIKNQMELYAAKDATAPEDNNDDDWLQRDEPPAVKRMKVM